MSARFAKGPCDDARNVTQRFRAATTAGSFAMSEQYSGSVVDRGFRERTSGVNSRVDRHAGVRLNALEVYPVANVISVPNGTYHGQARLSKGPGLTKTTINIAVTETTIESIASNCVARLNDCHR